MALTSGLMHEAASHAGTNAATAVGPADAEAVKAANPAGAEAAKATDVACGPAAPVRPSRVRTTAPEVTAEATRLEREGRLGLCRGFVQHGDVSVYEHVVAVAVESCRMADALARHGVTVDRPSLVRGALLHDYFLYDWHNPDPSHRLHGFRHPFFALRNAEDDFTLGEREHNIIARHMFPLVPVPPTCREAWIVCGADKLVALRETLDSRVPERLLPRWLKEAGR